MTVAINVWELSHRYGENQALDKLTVAVEAGEMFAILGPNGSGKTTLFRILCTLMNVQSGHVEVNGFDVSDATAAVRRQIGIVFQAPSLDKKLTVRENIRYGAMMYGVHGSELLQREKDLMGQLGIHDRAHDYVETLSGGLRRRVELAKGIIHRPQVLLLDEPSTGLDPAARADLWRYLRILRAETGVTIVFTTHILEEAEGADRIAILHEGKLVALDTPNHLRDSVGGESITIEANEPEQLAQRIAADFNCQADVIEGEIRLEQSDGVGWVARLSSSYGDEIKSIRLGKPSLEDVFINRTGHTFWQGAD